MSPNENPELEELLERHLRNELTELEMEQLAERLDTDPDARKELVDHVLWDTRLAEAMRGSGRPASEEEKLAAARSDSGRSKKFAEQRFLLGGAVVVIVVLIAGLFFQQARAEQRIAEISEIKQRPVVDPSIARITGLSGSLIWTGDRGQIVRDVKVGTELAGGTIEGMAPDSWFELEFNDGSTVMISGNSVLTFADAGQKELRLKEGSFSASVVPQPEGQPMLIHTRTALLKVLGTRFDVEAGLTSTVLNVSEGKVRVKRLSDGNEVDVTAKHRVTAEVDQDLTPVLVPDSVNHWKSQLHFGPDGYYGKWSRAIDGSRAASLKSIPLIPRESPSVTLYLVGIPVKRSVSSPVVVQPDSRFVVRGRLAEPAQVFFGIGMSQANGEFAGKFRGDLNRRQPVSQLDSDGRFEAVYRLSDFSLDPCVRDRKDELPDRPDGLILDGVWAFTHTGRPSGLEITEVELLPAE